jgi:N-acetyl-anhydromuramyl-L-alanine amidase AmpD
VQIEFIGCAPGNFRAGRRRLKTNEAGQKQFQEFKPEAIVIHIAVASLGSVDNSFRNPKHKASAHYCVGKTGSIHQYVKEEDTAFHAGVFDPAKGESQGNNFQSAPYIWSLLSSHLGVNTNLWTIGIEHEGLPDEEWTEEMYASSSQLISEISQRWPIPLDGQHVVPHHWIHKSKACPGSKVSIAKLIELASTPPQIP